MSDMKRTCPSCGERSSAVGYAFLNGDPCPRCAHDEYGQRPTGEAAKYTTAALREDVMQTSSWRFLHSDIGPAFDRWLVEHDAAVRDAALAEAEAAISAAPSGPQDDWGIWLAQGTLQELRSAVAR